MIGGLNQAFFDDRELSQKDLENEAKAQVPLSRMMSEEISELREWARIRARPSTEIKGEP